MMLGLTLLFGMLAFAHLGSTRAPQSGYRFEKGDSGKQEMILYFDQSVTIRTLRFIWESRKNDPLPYLFRMQQVTDGIRFQNQ